MKQSAAMQQQLNSLRQPWWPRGALWVGETWMKRWVLCRTLEGSFTLVVVTQRPALCRSAQAQAQALEAR